MPDVVVVGAGPVGTLAAAELARRGVDVALVERRGAEADGSRAIGVHAPVLAALEESGATERILAEARRVSAGEARSGGRLLGTVRFDRLSRRFPFVATLPQPSTQRAVAAHAPAPRHAEAVAVRPRAGGVTVALDDGSEVAAAFAVVAGGPRARALAVGMGPPRVRGYPDRYVMADVPAPGTGVAVVHLDAAGVLESFPLPAGRRRFVAPAPRTGALDDPETCARVLRDALHARGESAAADAVHAASSFAIRRTLLPRMRAARVFAIGDAAHEISPMGGQGMNLGLLDAVALAPLLVTWLRTGTEPEAQLRRWEARRLRSARTAAAIATANTMLGRPRGPAGDRVRRGMLRGVLATPLSTLFAHAYAMGFDAHA